MIKKFETILLEEAFDFIKEQDEKTRKKILQNIRRAECYADAKLFKKLTSDIWEFRTVYQGVQFRLLAFWDKESKSKTLVIATHGFVKKTNKVDKRQIVRAEKARNTYFKLNEK